MHEEKALVPADKNTKVISRWQDFEAISRNNEILTIPIVLNFHDMKLVPEQLALIKKFLDSKRVKKKLIIDLRNTGLGKIGLGFICESIANGNIPWGTVIDFSKNNLTTPDIEKLMTAIKSKSASGNLNLQFRYNSLNDDAGNKIISALKQTDKNIKLDVSHNYLTDECATDLQTYLRSHIGLPALCVDFSYNKLSKPLEKNLQDDLSAHIARKKLYFSFMVFARSTRDLLPIDILKVIHEILIPPDTYKIPFFTYGHMDTEQFSVFKIKPVSVKDTAQQKKNPSKVPKGDM